MSTTIDNRIVQMKFNNQQFESGAKTSLRTLEKLKESLNFDGVARGIEQSFSRMERSISVSGIAANVDSIADRFSNMGIVGQTVISNLTTKAMGLASTLSNLVISPIIEGGKRRALNIEAAKFQLAGLDVAWEDIEEDISYGVQDTAYGLDAAAKAASQLVASNVKLGDEMKSALRGISGVAAMTSSSYEDIANIFTTVAGNGRLMTEQLRMMSSRGLNAAAELAKQLNTTESAVRDMVSKGKVDFKMFSDAMNKAYGDHAKDANKTFTGAMSNTKAALSRIGAKFATPAYENLKNVLNEVIPVINGVNKALDPFVKLSEAAMKAASEFAQAVLKSIDTTKVSDIGDIIVNIVDVLKSLKNVALRIVHPVRSAFREMFPDSALKKIKDVSKRLSDLSKNFKISDTAAKKIQITFKGIFSVFKSLGDAVSSIVNTLAPAIDIFRYLADMVLSFSASAGEKLSVFFSSADDSFKFKERLKSVSDSVKEFIQKLPTIFAEAEPNIERISRIFKRSFGSVIPRLKTLWNDIKPEFDVISEKISKVSGSIIEFLTKPFNPQKIKNIKWFADILASLTNTVIHLANAVVNFAIPIKDAVLEMIPKMSKNRVTSIAEALESLSARLIASDTVMNNIKRTVKGFIAVLDIAAQAVAAVIRTIFPTAESFFDLGDGVLSVTGGLGDFLVLLAKTLRENDTFYSAIQKVIRFFRSGFQTAKEAVSEFAQIISKVFGKELKLPTKDSIEQFWENAKDIFSYLPNLLLTAKDSLTTFFGIFKDDKKGTAQETIENIAHAFGVLGDMAKEYAPGLIDFFKNIGKAFDGIHSERMSKLLNIGFFIVLINSLNRLRGVLATLFSYGRPMHNLNGVLTGIKGSLTEFSIKLKADSLLSIAKAITLLAASLVALSMVKEERLTSALSAMVILFAALLFAMSRVDKIAMKYGGGFGVIDWGMTQVTTSLVIFSAAVSVLGTALHKFSGLPFEDILKGIAAVSIVIFTFSMYLRLTAAVSELAAFTGKTMIQAASSIVVLGIAVNIIASAFKKFNSVTDSGLVNGIAAVGLTILEFALTMAPLLAIAGPHIAILAKYMISLTTPLILFGVAVNVIALAFKKFNKVEWSSITKGVMALASVLSIFSMAFISIMKYVEPFYLKFVVFAAGFSAGVILLSFSMRALAQAFKSFNKVDWSSITKGLLAFTNILIIVSAVSTKFALAAPAILIISGAMIIAATVMTELGAAFLIFNKVDWSSITKGLLALTNMLIIFGIVPAKLAVFAPAMLNFSGALFALGLALVSIAAAITIFVPALAMLGNMKLSSIAKGIIALGGSLLVLTVIAGVLGQFSIQVLSFISTIFVFALTIELLASAMITFIPILASFGAMSWSSIAKGLLTAAGAIIIFALAVRLFGSCIGTLFLFASGVTILGIAIAGVAALLGGLLLLVGDSLEKLAQVLIDSIPRLTQIAFDVLLALVNGIADAVRNNSEEIWLALRNLFSALLELLLSGIEQLFRDFVPGIGEKMADGVKYARECVRDYWAPAAKDAGAETSGSFAEGLGLNLPSVTDIGNQFGINFADGAGSMTDLANSAGINLGDSFANGLESTDGNTINVGNMLGQNAVNALDADTSEAGEGVGNSFAFGLSNTDDTVSNSADGLTNTAVESLVNAEGNFFDSGEESGDSYSSGLLSMLGSSKNSGEKVADSANSGANSKSSDFRQTGYNAGKGFADGLYLDSRGEVYTAATNLARVALNAMMVTLDSHSPSREFEKFGIFSGQGYAGGLVKMMGLVCDSSEDLADAALGTVSGAMAQASDILANDIDVDPTIRPVVDLTDVENSAGVIGSIFGDQSLSVGTVSGRLARKNIAAAHTSSDPYIFKAENQKIVNAIGELRGDITTLAQAILGMDVRLDSGELVGALAGPMDSELGRIAVRRGRRV